MRDSVACWLFMKSIAFATSDLLFVFLKTFISQISSNFLN